MQELKKLLPDVNWNYLLQRGVAEVANRQRERYEKVGYVLFTLPTTMPPLPEPRNFIQRRIMGEPPMSLTELEQAFRMIAGDERAAGAILHLRGTSMGHADLQTLRTSILRLREKGKRVICYSHGYDTAAYYVASAADAILLQPGGSLMTVGLRMNAIFLKDALDSLGVEVEAVAISPYKTAADRLTRADMSEEDREQFDWLLDSFYERIQDDIAAGRSTSTGDVRKLIDGAPYTDREALDAGYVDALVNEEDLADYLDVPADEVVSWDEARKRLYMPVPRSYRKHVALMSITGMIVPGESRNPPGRLPVPVLGGARSGDLTVVQQARRLMEDEQVGAVVLFVDSPGGEANASEAMTSALAQLAQRVPLVVYMNNVAASGGYYVATPARWIVAQPGTITGSIGVIGAKVVTEGMFQKLKTSRVELTRGDNATFLSDQQPLNDEQRIQMQKGMERAYDQFTGRVAEARGMTQNAVDAVGGGRVWTGAQAFEHGLVDQLGDLRAALDKARELAKLPEDAPLMVQKADKQDHLAPRLAESLDPAASSLLYAYEGLRLIYNGQAQMLMPFSIE